MAESKFPVPSGESATPPVKMQFPKKPEFMIATQTPEQLAIQFDNERTKRLMKIILIVFFLLPIALMWVVPLSTIAGPPGLPQYTTFEEDLAKSASIQLPIFWGLDLLCFIIAILWPMTDSFRIDALQGKVNLHTIYAFRKKEKNTENQIKDIAGLSELRFHFKKNQFFILMLELHSGRRIQVYKSGYQQVIHELYDIAQKYLPALGIQVNPGVNTSSG